MLNHSSLCKDLCYALKQCISITVWAQAEKISKNMLLRENKRWNKKTRETSLLKFFLYKYSITVIM